jgi:hypothetical protein
MPLHLVRLVGGLALLAASTVLQGCDRSGRRAEETSQAARPGDSAAAPAASLPQQIADVVVKLNGGVHTGFRFMHAKGIVVSGTFTPEQGSQVGEPGRALQRPVGAGDGSFLQCSRYSHQRGQ